MAARIYSLLMVLSQTSDMVLGGVFGGSATIVLTLALELMFDVFRLRTRPITPLMRVVGAAMMFEFVSIIIGGFAMRLYPHIMAFAYTGFLLDTMVSCTFCLAVATMLYNGYPRKAIVAAIIIPFILVPAILVALNVPRTFDGIVMGLLPVALYSFLAIKFFRHDKMLEYYYSNLENRTKVWILTTGILLMALGAIYYTLTLSFALYQSWLIAAYIIASDMVYIYIAVRAFRNVPTEHIEVMEQEQEQEQEQDENNESENEHACPHASDAQTEEFKQQLTRLMEEEHLYRNPELTVDDLVKELGTNTTYFYYFMRDVMQVKFYDYVNGYRVNEAKRMLEQSGEKISQVAYECGFNSPHTFSRTFKRYTGMLPSEWRTSGEK